MEEEIKKDISKLKEISAVEKTKGGQRIIKSAKKDIIAAIDNIANSYQTLNHAELMALAARLQSRLELYRLIVGAKDTIKELEKVLDDLTGEQDEDY